MDTTETLPPNRTILFGGKVSVVPLTDGYNGNLTSKQNGSVGGYMVKKMIEQQERQMSSGSQGGQY